MGKRRRRYTAEERAERDAQDQTLRAAAHEALADPDTAAAYAGRIARSAGGIHRYSLRNQALLLSQADERGLELTGDLDTFAGWCARGRVPNGPGLRIRCPKGRRGGQEEDTGADEPQDAIACPSEDAEADAEVKFGMEARFDFCQTVALDTADEVQENPAETGDPGAWTDGLIAQAERIGYTVELAAETSEVDGTHRIVRVADTQPAEQAVSLARQLAAVVTARGHDGAAESPQPAPAGQAQPATPAGEQEPDDEDEAGPQVLRLSLGTYGTATVRPWTDLRGRACYQVTAPRVTGVFTLIPAYEPSTYELRPSRVEVRYGEPDPADAASTGRMRPLANTPTVNGVDLAGGLITDPAALVNGCTRARPSRRTGPLTTEPAPEATRERAAAVVQALAEHWYHRPDRGQLVDAAARMDAQHRANEVSRDVQQLDERIAQLTAERDELAGFRDGLQHLTSAEPEPAGSSSAATAPQTLAQIGPETEIPTRNRRAQLALL